MKRDAFERYVRDRKMRGYTAEDIINEIDEMVSKYGNLVLENDRGDEIIIEQFWLNNFKYREHIEAVVES